MNKEIPSSCEADRKRWLARLTLALYLGVVGGVFSGPFKNLIQTHEGPWWVRVGLVIVPFVVFGAPAWFLRRWWRPDELEVLKGREAALFAFNGFFFCVVTVDLLQRARLLGSFTWTTNSLILVNLALLLAGMARTKLRYR